MRVLASDLHVLSTQEHGIHVPNRRFDRPRQAQPAAAEEQNAEQQVQEEGTTATTTRRTRQIAQDASVNILYTPNVAPQTTATTSRARSTRASKATKRKKKSNDDDDDFEASDDDDFLPVVSSSTPRAAHKPRAGRTRVEFCSQCKSRFSKAILPGMEESSSSGPLLCPSCQKGEKNQPAPKKRRRIARNGMSKKIGNDGYIEVPSLQDVCIKVSKIDGSISRAF
jgi:hypothetical protein